VADDGNRGAAAADAGDGGRARRGGGGGGGTRGRSRIGAPAAKSHSRYVSNGFFGWFGGATQPRGYQVRCE
jgi:hypothetical protein